MASQLTTRQVVNAPAHPAPRGAQLVDIRCVAPHQLHPLLLEQTAEWRLKLDWDFTASAGLVRRLIETHRISGVALLDGEETAGYGYTGLDGHKGLIVDVYVRPRWRGGNAESLLFRVLLESLAGTAGVNRIEGQLMLVDTAAAGAIQRAVQSHIRNKPGSLRLFERFLMTLDAKTPLPCGNEPTGGRFRVEPWSDRHRDAAAAVTWLSYIGHVDSQIDDQYRSLADASRRLTNLVEFPGSAAFCPTASFVAYDQSTDCAAGICLASFVSADVAHISEICVTPDARGAGLGYELLRRSVESLRAAGAKRITLSVTAANQPAVNLYRRCGFHNLRRFHAYVWETPKP
jgi:GNAT superfamily N-acetyltransferase